MIPLLPECSLFTSIAKQQMSCSRVDTQHSWFTPPLTTLKTWSCSCTSACSACLFYGSVSVPRVISQQKRNNWIIYRWFQTIVSIRDIGLRHRAGLSYFDASLDAYIYIFYKATVTVCLKFEFHVLLFVYRNAIL